MKSNKMLGFYRMDRYGLNHHFAEAVTDIGRSDQLAEVFSYQFTIRTDRNTGIVKDLPFYLIDTKEQYYAIRDVLIQNIRKGLILILSDGHHYDKFLRYNLVLSVDYDGHFLAEYSSINVPLRHMYRYPKYLANVTGNVNDRYQNWDTLNRIAGGVDLREIESLINQQFLVIEKSMLYRRYLELSVYQVPCGTRHETVAYWEI